VPLIERPPFVTGRGFRVDPDVRTVLNEVRRSVPIGSTPLSIGFAPADTWPFAVRDVSRELDAYFALQPNGGLPFESEPLVLSHGIRASRFAPIVFWEALHVLATGGLWIDVDAAERIGESSIGAGDPLERPYFARSLDRAAQCRSGRWIATAWRKRAPTLVAARIRENGWTFGILTAGPSEHACRMAREIAGLGLREFEIVFCGPSPGDLTDVPNVRRIDLDRPEPRGWITRKKNLIAEAARYENLALLHDRFSIPSDFVRAAEAFGPVPGVTTFPQFFFPDATRTLCFRNVDYQAYRPIRTDARDAERLASFRLDQFSYPQYNDWRETFHINGGAYLTRRSLWLAVPQDEKLCHGDWEDVVHGVQCHAFGIPQRVNPHAVLETGYSHHSLLPLLSVPHMKPDGTIAMRRGFASPVFLSARLRAATLKPLTRVSEGRLRQQACAIVPRIPPGSKDAISRVLGEPITSFRRFWGAVSDALRTAHPTDRAEVAALHELLWRCAASPVWHANHLQRWIRAAELDDDAWGDFLERQRRYFHAWELLYPAFLEIDEAHEQRDTGPQPRRRRLQELHWRCRASSGLLGTPSSLGLQPSPALLPDRGERVSALTAALAVLLSPVGTLLSSGRVQGLLERALKARRRSR
jgi:hypothetical protein